MEKIVLVDLDSIQNVISDIRSYESMVALDVSRNIKWYGSIKLIYELQSNLQIYVGQYGMTVLDHAILRQIAKLSKRYRHIYIITENDLLMNIIRHTCNKHNITFLTHNLLNHPIRSHSIYDPYFERLKLALHARNA